MKSVPILMNVSYTTLRNGLTCFILSNICQTLFYRTSNKLERAHLLVIELEHPIFGF